MNFTEVELFLIEMAIDETMCRIYTDSPNYRRFELLSQKVRGYRIAQEHSNDDNDNGLGASSEIEVD